MIYFKHNIIEDLKVFFYTLFKALWLYRNGYYFYLLQPKCFFCRPQWKKIENLVKEELTKFKKFKADKEFIVYFTKFGTHGSYKLPNKVYINIFRKPKEIAETIVHEVVHLSVEHKVRAQKLSHDQKESLVNGLVKDTL